jgi:sugar phosphate isomerase/epimerase
MLKFGMCNEFCQGWPFERVLDLARDAGYEGVEIAPFTLADSVADIPRADRKKLRRAAKDRNIEIIGLHWLLVKPEGLYINHPNDEIRTRTAQYLAQLIDFCADLGGTRMIVGSPKQRSILPGETREDVWKRTVELFHPLADQAGEKGVIICIEPLAENETNFINSADEAIQLVRDVAHPAFQMMLDVKAMAAEGTNIPEIIHRAANFLRHFHANDPNLLGPGFGELDFRPIVQALREIGYDQWVSVEVFNFEPGPEAIARQSMEYLKKVFGDETS